MAILFFILLVVTVAVFFIYTGKTQRQIKNLTVDYYKNRGDMWFEHFNKAVAREDNLKLELAETQEGLERTTIAYSDSKSLNQALQDENKDLIRTLDLYKDVLDCVRFNVGHVTYSPAKKAKK